MNRLSLFNGMSVCQMAMIDAGIESGTTYISEIDKYANKASEALFGEPLSFIDWCQAFHPRSVDIDTGVVNTDELEFMYEDEYDLYVDNFKSQIQLGSVCDWQDWDIDWASIDLVTGGFPCQAWSMAGKQLGDKDERGMLFWTMLDIMKHVRHHNQKAHFLIENVKMKKEFEGYITTHTENALGEVHKILINSALVSAQNRNRYYWTSFPVTQPEDEGIVLADIIESDGEFGATYNRKVGLSGVKLDKSHVISASDWRGLNRNQSQTAIIMKQTARGFNKGLEKEVEKAPTLTKNSWEQNNKIKVDDDKKYRKLTPRECMRLQTILEFYIDILLNAGISNTQLYKMVGNAWTMKVISHILSCMPGQWETNK